MRKSVLSIFVYYSFYLTVRQNQFDKLCNTERGWAFERVINGALDGYDHKRKDGVESRNECARLCLLESEFQCRSAEYNSDAKLCILSREDRRTQPEAFRYNVIGVDYIENQCAKRKKTVNTELKTIHSGPENLKNSRPQETREMK